jgi:hypothetical protein
LKITLPHKKRERRQHPFDLYTVDDQGTLAVYEQWRKESDVWDIYFNQPYAAKQTN